MLKLEVGNEGGAVKQGYHHGDLRRALLQAAAEVIEEQGPVGLSLRDLARRAGVSHAAPTHHFGDKAGLLTALAEEGYDLLAAELTEQWSRTSSFLDQGVAYVQFALRHRAHFEVMFRPDLYHPTEPALIAAQSRATKALYLGIGDAPRPSDEAAPAEPGSNSVASSDPALDGLAVDGLAMDGPAADGPAVDGPAPEGPASGVVASEIPLFGGASNERVAGLAAWSIAHGFATLWVSGTFPRLPGSPDEIARAVLGRLPPP